MRRDGYAAFNELLVANMRHAGALRIDHAMGLRRLFIIPDGATGADGAYVTYPRGTCSPRSRCKASAHAAWSSVRIWAPSRKACPTPWPRPTSCPTACCGSSARRDVRPPAEWRRLAAACVSTHDLATLAGWWDGTDIDEKHALACSTTWRRTWPEPPGRRKRPC